MVLGQLAVVIALTLVYIPFVGGYLTILPALMAVVAGPRGVVFALGTIVINVIHLLFLSPLLHRGALTSLEYGNRRPLLILSGLVGMQLLAGVVCLFRYQRSRRGTRKPDRSERSEPQG